jgi:hypothetical protein
MDEEQAIKAEMRLWALEALVTNLLAMICTLDRDPAALLNQIRGRMIEGAKSRTFPGYDAAMSDLLSAELEAAVTRLMDMGTAQITRPQEPRGEGS